MQMKRVLTSAVAAALLVAGTGSEAQSQEARISLFDLGIYAGGAWTTTWLERPNAENITPGFSPIGGATATFWTNPNLGVRTHVGYTPIDLPQGASHSMTNFWLYDLSLVARPWITDAGMAPLMASMYFWLGGGGVTSNVPGRANACVQPYQAADGACLHIQARRGSVGQGTAGLGVDVLPLGGNLAVFGEVGAHGYSSPFHTGPGWAPNAGANQATDPLAFTVRAVLGLKMMLGDLAPIPVVAPPPPPPAPAPTPAPQPQAIQVCVIQDGQLRTVTAQFNPATGDTTMVVDGQTRRFRDVQPGTQAYATGRTWFVQGEPIQFMNRRYVRFGLTRVIGAGELTRVGEHQGVPVFAPTGQTTAPDVIYLPVRPGCEFQPFQHEAEIQVRG
jgi:hypothetical protein